ncbi:GspH/FimT family pseudopilin [Allochromatium humboldtianum]
MGGVTLIELMVSLSVLAILATIAIPSYTGFMDRYRLEGAIQGLYADLQFARSESVKCNRRVRVTFTTGSTWSYTISRIGSCTNSSDSTTVTDLKTVGVASFPATQIASTTLTSNTLFFEPRFGNVEHGGSTSGTTLSGEAQVNFQSGQGKQARVLVNLIGRVRYCSPSGSNNLIGIPTC